MYPALLLPLLFAAAPGEPAATPPSVPAIQIWLNNDRRFFPGDQGRVQVQTLEDGYLVVLHVDPDGHLRIVFPVDPTDDNFIRGGKKYEVRGRAGRETFDVDNRTGHGTIYAAVSKSAFRFDDFVLGDHWDYKTVPDRPWLASTSRIDVARTGCGPTSTKIGELAASTSSRTTPSVSAK